MCVSKDYLSVSTSVAGTSNALNFNIVMGSKGKKREVSALSVPDTSESKVIPADCYRLNCLIEGETFVFNITIPSDNVIDNLKGLIYEYINSAERANFAARQLELLKVRSVPILV